MWEKITEMMGNIETVGKRKEKCCGKLVWWVRVKNAIYGAKKYKKYGARAEIYTGT